MLESTLFFTSRFGFFFPFDAWFLIIFALFNFRKRSISGYGTFETAQSIVDRFVFAYFRIRHFLFPPSKTFQVKPKSNWSFFIIIQHGNAVKFNVSFLKYLQSFTTNDRKMMLLFLIAAFFNDVILIKRGSPKRPFLLFETVFRNIFDFF